MRAELFLERHRPWTEAGQRWVADGGGRVSAGGAGRIGRERTYHGVCVRRVGVARWGRGEGGRQRAVCRGGVRWWWEGGALGTRGLYRLLGGWLA